MIILKDKIQALVDAGVLTLKSEQMKVTANMATLNFGTFLKMTVQDGVTPVSKIRLDVINLMAEVQKDKGLVSMMTKSEEIMWVHPDIIKDEQWESSKPKLKGKSCNIVSLATDDDVVIIASLSDSEEEKLALVAQPDTSQPAGTQSGKPYLRQYDQTPQDTQQPTTSGITAPVQASVPPPPLDKGRQKKIRFDKSLKKDPPKGLNTPFRFDMLAQLANIPACITLYEPSPLKGDKRGT